MVLSAVVYDPTIQNNSPKTPRLAGIAVHSGSALRQQQPPSDRLQRRFAGTR